jgi:tetratricopeptide (TPR) repeat protein
MNRKTLTFVLGFLVASMLAGCGASNKLRAPSGTAKAFNREAMDHIISGAIEDLMGNPKGALVEYHQAAEIDTSSAGIYLAIAEDYYILNELPMCVRMAKKALRSDAKNMDAMHLLAGTYNKLRQFRNAAQVYEKIIKLEPDNLEALYNLTYLQIVLNDDEGALKTYLSMVRNGLDDEESRLRVGHVFLQKRALRQAIQIYSSLMRDFPNSEAAYLALAATYVAKGDTARAIEIYRDAVSSHPSFDDAKAELRLVLEKSRRWNDAIQFYQDLVVNDSTNLTDKLQLGQFYFQKGDTSKAADWFKSIVAQHPQSERAYLALASIQKIKGDTLASAQTYKNAIEENPGFLDARRRLRDIYVGNKQWDSAIALYEPLTDNDTTYVGARIEIANLLMQKGDSLKAIDLGESLLQTHGNDWRIPLTLGRFYVMRNQNSQAAVYLNKAIELQDNLPGLWILRGINFIQMDSLDRAGQNFEQALTKFPQDAEINYYLGTVLSRQRKFEQAVKYLAAADEAEPGDSRTMLALAAACDELRQYNRSEELYSKLLKMDPNSPIILNNYAYHLSVRGTRLDEALVMVKKALEADSNNAPYLDTLGWIYYQIGDYQNAKTYIEKSLELRTDSAEVMEHLGDVYFKLGDKTSAEQFWRRALDSDENRQHILEKLGQFKE